MSLDQPQPDRDPRDMSGGMIAGLDKALLRELAAELGYWPATTRPEDTERHRQFNDAHDAALTKEQLARRYAPSARREGLGERNGVASAPGR